MANGGILEMSSLPTLHPKRGEALSLLIPAAIIRLSHDPVARPPGTIAVTVDIGWARRGGDGTLASLHRVIGWAGQSRFDEAVAQLPFTKNSHDLTEEAAIVVAALLLGDLEQATIESVLEIGSGGDYLIRCDGGATEVQLEVSGIREDATGAATRARVAVKSAQVVSHARAGFASVTAFSHGSPGNPYSSLTFVKGRRSKKRK